MSSRSRFPSCDLISVAILDLVTSAAIMVFFAMELPNYFVLESAIIFIIAIFSFGAIFINRVVAFAVTATINCCKIVTYLVMIVMIAGTDLMLEYKKHLVVVMIVHLCWLLVSLLYVFILVR